MLDLIIKNGSCYISGKLEKQDIGIKNGKILEIGTLKAENSKDSKPTNINKPVIPTNIPTNWVQLKASFNHTIEIIKAKSGEVPFKTDMVPAFIDKAE